MLSMLIVPIIQKRTLKIKHLSILNEFLISFVQNPEFCSYFYSEFDCNPKYGNTVTILFETIFEYFEYHMAKKIMNEVQLKDIIISFHLLFSEIMQKSVANNDSHELITSTKARKTDLEKGIKRFNANPTNGIELMINSQVLTDSRAEIAQFLLNEHRLDRAAIGIFISNQTELSEVFIL